MILGQCYIMQDHFSTLFLPLLHNYMHTSEMYIPIFPVETYVAHVTFMYILI